MAHDDACRRTQHAVATTADSGGNTHGRRTRSQVYTDNRRSIKKVNRFFWGLKNTAKNLASSNRNTHTHTHRFLQRGALSVPFALQLQVSPKVRKLVLQRPAKLLEEQSKGPGPLQEEFREACLAEIDVGIVKGPALLFDLSGVEDG